MMRIDLPDLAAMDALGAVLARVVRAGDAILLSGGLGAGKTTLARAIIGALGYRHEVPSPSFAIIQMYDPPELLMPVIHADFYRLTHPDELYELGLDDELDRALLIAEWPAMALRDWGPAALHITLSETVDGGRSALLQPGADWLERMPCL